MCIFKYCHLMQLMGARLWGQSLAAKPTCMTLLVSVVLALVH